MRINPRSENRLLAALSEKEYDHLHSRMEHVSMPIREILYTPGEPIRHIYFPLNSVATLLVIMEDGSSVEVGVIGNEGMVGIPVFWGVQTTPHQVVVLIPGGASKLPAQDLKELLDFKDSSLHGLLLRYTHALVSCISQTAACNRLHPINGRLSRWLLVSHDRAGADDFPLTHDFVADLLGCRRAGVSEAASFLKEEKLIDYHRGRVIILDREGLESLSCECYEIVKQSFDYYLGVITQQPARQAALSTKQFADLGSAVRGNIRTDLPTYKKRVNKTFSASLLNKP